MNKRIKELAEQAGWMMDDEVEGFNTRLEKFAELVRADEREACARTASEQATFGYDGHRIAKAIRAKGDLKPRIYTCKLVM